MGHNLRNIKPFFSEKNKNILKILCAEIFYLAYAKHYQFVLFFVCVFCFGNILVVSPLGIRQTFD